MKLQKQWKTTGPWTMLSLGKGYYEFSFASENDLRSVWAFGTVSLKPSVLRLFERTKDFNLHNQPNTHAHVWVRLMELPQEYWIERTIREIASVVGTSLLIDNVTSKCIFGRNARVLVDMNFSKKIFHELLVEREGFSFCVEVAYEWLLVFCSHCQNLSHNVATCCWLYPRNEGKVSKENSIKGKKQIPTSKQDWVPI